MPDKIAASLKGVYTTIYRKFYIDEIYLFVTQKILFNVVSQSIAWFDRHIIDATMDGFATVTNYASESVKELQSGQIQKYGFVFISGVFVFAFILIYVFVY